MLSMTGHGRGEARDKGTRASVECSSVNRRGAEVALSGSSDWSPLEPKIREAVLEVVARGRVNVTISVTSSGGAVPQVINTSRAVQYHRDLAKLRLQLGLEREVALELVLAGPGVVEQKVNVQQYWPLLEEALKAALNQLVAMRRKEGRFLKKSILTCLRTIEVNLRTVAKLAPGVPVRHRKVLESRIREAELSVRVDPERLATEVAIYADRSDVTEEIERLWSHCAQFKETTGAEGLVGRKLEFIAQEMGREWNTIGSKANDAKISQCVIEAKSQLDKIREQAANIE